jgi:hypothetical protein
MVLNYYGHLFYSCSKFSPNAVLLGTAVTLRGCKVLCNYVETIDITLNISVHEEKRRRFLNSTAAEAGSIR